VIEEATDIKINAKICFEKYSTPSKTGNNILLPKNGRSTPNSGKRDEARHRDRKRVGNEHKKKLTERTGAKIQIKIKRKN
jgi:hypothetical protein